MPFSDSRAVVPSGYHALVDAHYDRVLRLCRVLLGDHHEAQDVAQETFLKLHLHYASRDVSDWRAWLTRVAVNAVRDRQRAGWWPRWRRRTEPLDDARLVAQAPRPDVAADAKESYRRIQAAFARLPRRQREVFALRQLEGLSTAATAAALRLSEGSVKRHLYRAVDRLRRAVRDGQPGSPRLWST
ncbi:MAG TPA: RNA polymerase sigma factor [Methylomirabilota bacterium]|jgi:RNA polymerase sigma-70 factor (ECF subfamily)